MKKSNNVFSVKNGFLYLGFLQLMVLLSLAISIPVQFLVAMLVPETQWVLNAVLNALLSLAIECIAVVVLFRIHRCNNRRMSRREYLMPCAFALPVHGILCLLTGCYPYTIGWFVSKLGDMLGSLMVGYRIEDRREIPYYLFIPLTGIMLGFLYLSIYIGNRWGEAKIKKEYADITGKTYSEKEKSD